MSEQEARDTTTDAERLEELSDDPALRIVVASNPAAPAKLLEALARDPDVQVRAAVVSNPNAPWPTLEELAWEFPHAFLHNPVGALQMMVSPGQISTDLVFWEGVLREAPVSPLWWHRLLSQPDLRTSHGIRLHVQYAGESISPYGILQEGEDHDVLLLMELLPAASSQKVSLVPLPEQLIRERLRWLAHSCDTDIRRRVASHP